MESRKLPLKRTPSGNVIEVTEENKMEYLKLYVQHRYNNFQPHIARNVS